MARKFKNIAQGKPDGRRNNKVDKTGADGIGKATRFTSENNPNKKKNGNANNGKHLPVVGKEYQFKKGHEPANKLLRTRLKDRGFTREVINEMFADILTASPKKLAEIKVDEDTSMLELIGISIAETSNRIADTGRIEWLMTQILGKQVQRTENINYNINSSTEASDSDAERTRKFIEEKARSWEQH